MLFLFLCVFIIVFFIVSVVFLFLCMKFLLYWEFFVGRSFGLFFELSLGKKGVFKICSCKENKGMDGWMDSGATVGRMSRWVDGWMGGR